MSPSSRRILSYWVLLLVPTLAVGIGAIQLLRREQARIAEQSALANEARRAASAARARLVAENVELLVGDVQAGLLDALAAIPATELDRFLDQWRQSNPLVRVAFRARVSGALLRPNAAAADEEARGFVRRFSQVLAVNPPWATAAAPTVQKEQASLKLQQQGVATNVANVQSVRRDVQELLQNDYVAKRAATPPASYGVSAEARARSDSVGLLADARAEDSTVRLQREPAGQLRKADSSLVAKTKTATKVERDGATVNVTPPLQAQSGSELRKDSSDRRGWAPLLVDGRLHLLGWVQSSQSGGVRGVEVDLMALVSRMAGVLPAESGAGEGYALRDGNGQVLHQVGFVPRSGEVAARVPLAAALLPGWDVVAYLAPPPNRGVDAAGFFWTGSILVAILVVAILAGGSLLWRQAQRSEAEAAQKTSFVANVSHEFKTPLTTIRLYAELLEQGRVRDREQAGDYLRTIGRETQRLARLVNNALDFSRLEQGRKKFAPEKIELTAELNRILDALGPRLADAGMTLRRELPATPCEFVTDRDALEQVLLNLLDNACKYAASGGEIVVSMTCRLPDRAEIRVADRGPGVPPAHREKIFEKFHRVDDSLTAEKAGAGLGLSIARQLARGLGGDLRYAERTGGGAEFVLELPADAQGEVAG